jgi:hypothetical protein
MARASFAPSGLPSWEKALSPELDHCRTSTPVVSRSRSGSGVDVLGACRAVAGLDLVVAQEVDARTAFKSIHELRNVVLLIALAGALLVTAFGWALVVRLIRPIEALIEGARAVSSGELLARDQGRYQRRARVSGRRVQRDDPTPCRLRTSSSSTWLAPRS